MRFPARYADEVLNALKVLGWNLCPCTGEPQIEVIIRPVLPPFVIDPVFDMLEGDETPVWSGSEVADDA